LFLLPWEVGVKISCFPNPLRSKGFWFVLGVLWLDQEVFTFDANSSFQVSFYSKRFRQETWNFRFSIDASWSQLPHPFYECVFCIAINFFTCSSFFGQHLYSVLRISINRMDKLYLATLFKKIRTSCCYSFPLL